MGGAAVTEWKLWEGDEPPFFTQPDFFTSHPRIAGEHQVGYYERQQLVANTVTRVASQISFKTLTDLGCGDGTLLAALRNRVPHIETWGYELGEQNVAHARGIGMNVTQADFVHDDVTLGECVLLTEVLEHLVDPHALLRKLDASLLIATSPAGETDRWHYEHHAWAWDADGFHALFLDTGWMPISYDFCVARDSVVFGPSGRRDKPVFQCIVVERA